MRKTKKHAEKIAETHLRASYMSHGAWFSYQQSDEYKRAIKAIEVALDEGIKLAATDYKIQSYGTDNK